MKDTLRLRLSLYISLTVLLVGALVGAVALYGGFWQALAAALAAFLLGILAAGRIAGWVSRPIAELVRGTAEFSAGNLGHRVEAGSPGEMAALAAGFNEMAASLQEKIESLDASRKEAEGLTARLTESAEESRQTARSLQHMNEWVTDMAFRLEEANQELKAGKVQTDTIVHSIRDGILALDASERVILMNPEAEEIFGVREEQARGEHVRTLVDKLSERVEDSGEFLKKYMAVSSSPETETSFVVTLVRPYRRVLRRLSSAIRDESGGMKGRVVTFKDITKEREVDEMKTNFVSTVSHELRTPLTSIKGAINLLMESEIEDAETRREFLKIAEQNTDRLINLITNLLDLSRMEEGGGHIRFTRIDLNQLARGVVKSTSVIARQSGVSVEVSCPDGPLTVLGDREKLEQVVTNLAQGTRLSSPAPAAG
ncbi:MAG: HAMP domain-containing protein [Nitrospirae bacterium]|nr:HAMP domain-containing protein [Nitrospirota bacterium]